MRSRAKSTSWKVIKIPGQPVHRVTDNRVTLTHEAQHGGELRSIRVFAGNLVREQLSRLDPALTTLAHEGPARFRDQFELVHRHRASHPNAIWQADHTQLDMLIRDASGEPVRPWLTTVIGDHSRALPGYLVFAGAPSAFQTSLALRQAIWRKADPSWAICGIPDVLYVDHGSDFTSKHLEQVAVDLHFELVYSTVARHQGRGKLSVCSELSTQNCCRNYPAT